MSSNLKKLVLELKQALIERGGSLDAPARDAFQAQIDNLEKVIDAADKEELRRLTLDVFNLMATLLAAITNVMQLLK